MTSLSQSEYEDVDDIISKISKEIQGEVNKYYELKISHETTQNLKILIDAYLEKRVNNRFKEEGEKYEDCLKKLESDIRKHIKVIYLTK